jgi:hypothetical protein
MRGKTPRSELDLFGYFLGQLPKSNPLGRRPSGTPLGRMEAKTLDSGLRRNDEQRKGRGSAAAE